MALRRSARRPPKKDRKSLSEDEKKRLWVDKEWSRFMKRRKSQKIDGELVKEFLEDITLPVIKRPAAFNTWSGVIHRSIEEERGTALTRQTMLEITRWASEKSRALAATKLYESKQSETMTMDRVTEVCTTFWRRPWKNMSFKQMALVLAIAANTGARIGELLNSHIEDIEVTTDGDDTFFRFPLRTSKTNPNKSRPESLILTINKERDPLPMQEWMREIIGDRTTGKMITLITTPKINAHLRKLYKERNWGKAPTGHGCRSTFVVTSLDAGANEADVISACRWQSYQMLDRYRNTHRQCTKQGPAFKIAELKRQLMEETEKTVGPEGGEQQPLSTTLRAANQSTITSSPKSVATQTEPWAAGDSPAAVAPDDELLKRWKDYLAKH